MVQVRPFPVVRDRRWVDPVWATEVVPREAEARGIREAPRTVVAVKGTRMIGGVAVAAVGVVAAGAVVVRGGQGARRGLAEGMPVIRSLGRRGSRGSPRAMPRLRANGVIAGRAANSKGRATRVRRKETGSLEANRGIGNPDRLRNRVARRRRLLRGKPEQGACVWGRPPRGVGREKALSGARESVAPIE